MSKTNKTILKEKHLNTILLESYKPESKSVDGSPVIASFKINVTTENLENHNGRVYKSEVWNQPYSLQKGGKYLDESGKLRPLSLLGNLDHPRDNHGEVFLQEAGLAWYNLEKTGSDWMGTAHVLDTPQGKVIKTFLEYAKQFGGGEQIGVSTRALGDAIIIESNNGPVEEILPDGFELVSIDFVYNPSSIYSNTPLMESKHKGNKMTLVESIKKLKESDDRIGAKEIYEAVIEDLDVTNKKVLNEEWTYTRYYTKDEKKFRELCDKHNVKVGPETLENDGMYKVRIEGDFDDVHKVRHIWSNYLFNGVLEESKGIEPMDLNQLITEAQSIDKAKAEYVKQLKEIEHKLHNAIYTIDNMSDDEYKQTKYYVDTPNKKDFLSKLTKEHEAVLAEIKAAESLTENKGDETVGKEEKKLIEEQEVTVETKQDEVETEQEAITEQEVIVEEEDKDETEEDVKDGEEDVKDGEEMPLEEKVDHLMIMVEDILIKLDELFAPIEPLESTEDLLPEDNEDLNDIDEEDVEDFDIDSMTEDELLSLEELLELE